RRAGRFGGLPSWLGAVPPRRMLLGGAAGAFATVLIATAVVSIGGSGTGEVSDSDLPSDRLLSPSQATPGGSAQDSAGAAGATGHSADTEFQDRAGIEAAPARPAPAAPSPSPSGPFASQQSRRAVERSARLVLGTDPEGVRPAADRVFATVGRYDGIVLRSSIRDGASGEAGADFSLLIPSDRLGAALTDLSSIAEVRSREETAQDITAPTVTVSDHLREARAEVEGLLEQLAGADSDSERAAIKEQLRFHQRRVATLRASLNDLRRRANFSRVSVQLLTGDAAVFPAAGEDRWTIGDAAADAVRILAIAAGVTLVGLAALGPIALLALLAWLGRRAWVRAGRERALEG
ncbi:MAG: DUF4349 domain-containing protein, partial [Solirubrobacterales bacterium]